MAPARSVCQMASCSRQMSTCCPRQCGTSKQKHVRTVLCSKMIRQTDPKKIGDQSASQAKSKTLICSKLSHGGKIAGNSLSQPPALFIFPSCFQLLLHSKEKILAIDLGTSDIDSTTGHFPDLLNSTPVASAALASCQLFGSSKNK